MSEYNIPSDWPALDGPIDTRVQDYPHDSANTEWWYVNSHVKGVDGNDYSIFVSFFRVYTGIKNGKKQYGHALSAAISDVSNKKYYPIARVDKNSHAVLKYQFDNDMYKIDKRLEAAYREMLDKGRIPLPDVPFEEYCTTNTIEDGNFKLTYNDCILEKLDNGDYHMIVNSADKILNFEMTFTPLKPAQRQGNNGVVQVGVKRETMFYYFIPRNACKGTLTIPSKVSDVVSLPGYNLPESTKTIEFTGTSWLDHEFGGSIRDNVYSAEQSAEKAAAEEEVQEPKAKKAKKAEKDDSFAWNWFSLQLDNGMDITATNLIDTEINKVVDNFIITIGKDGERTEYKDFKVSSANNWISPKTSCTYPLQWKLTSEQGKIDITLNAAFENQEIITFIAKPAFWEGILHVTGTVQGVPVTGKAFTERHGFDGSDSLENFFKRLSLIVREEIHKVLPYNPTYEEARDLLADDDNDHYMHGSSTEVLENIIIKPLRDVIDRGGKAWRSYACLLSIDCVGGDSWDYKHWLSMPELMHVGSLIIDDIQDKSETRRGFPTCHKVYGESIAINAGTAAYFLAMDILQRKSPNLTAELRNRLYGLYFLTLRAGHCGQGFDIYGLDYLMEDVIKNGASQKLLDAITCTHRLKSAVPAGNLARMGATIANGTEQQIEAMGRYYEAIGVAFQIVDDVLNLRGFEGDGKTRGEDLHEGKITYPVARGMVAMKDKAQRESFYNRLSQKPVPYDIVKDLIKELDDVKAIDDSWNDAQEMVEKAFAELDEVIPDSFFKIMLRSFGFFVLQRHY